MIHHFLTSIKKNKGDFFLLLAHKNCETATLIKSLKIKRGPKNKSRRENTPKENVLSQIKIERPWLSLTKGVPFYFRFSSKKVLTHFRMQNKYKRTLLLFSFLEKFLDL